MEVRKFRKRTVLMAPLWRAVTSLLVEWMEVIGCLCSPLSLWLSCVVLSKQRWIDGYIFIEQDWHL
jgi:hypothetical protein